MTDKMQPFCPNCGSTEICADGAARWDIETQDWVLSSTYDDMTCDDCGAEHNLLNTDNWKPIGVVMAKCGNCSRVEPAIGLEGVADLNTRLDPGSVVPAGECSECGCFHYLVGGHDT